LSPDPAAAAAAQRSPPDRPLHPASLSSLSLSLLAAFRALASCSSHFRFFADFPCCEAPPPPVADDDRFFVAAGAFAFAFAFDFEFPLPAVDDDDDDEEEDIEEEDDEADAFFFAGAAAAAFAVVAFFCFVPLTEGPSPVRLKESVRPLASTVSRAYVPPPPFATRPSRDCDQSANLWQASIAIIH
jgi:hypothetical protein